MFESTIDVMVPINMMAQIAFKAPRHFLGVVKKSTIQVTKSTAAT